MKQWSLKAFLSARAAASYNRIAAGPGTLTAPWIIIFCQKHFTSGRTTPGLLALAFCSRTTAKRLKFCYVHPQVAEEWIEATGAADTLSSLRHAAGSKPLQNLMQVAQDQLTVLTAQ